MASLIRRVRPAGHPLSKEISFVVQGPIVNQPARRGSVTGSVLRSIRRHYPDSRIILSTWNGADTSELDYDQLVESSDPGSYMRDKHNRIFHNVNRQVTSSLAGLRAVDTKYAVKIRSDLSVFGAGIERWLTHPARFAKRGALSFLEERAIVVNTTSVNPRKGLPLPFHPCDWIYCGLTKDLLDIWDAPEFPEPEWTWWFESRPKPDNFPFETSLARYHPENYIWSTFVGRHHPISFGHSSDTGKDQITLSEQTIADNLIILSRRQLQVSWSKPVAIGHLSNMYDYSAWKALVKDYSGGSSPRLVLIEPLVARLAHYAGSLSESALPESLKRMVKAVFP